ncbi:hypothetical protein [Gryllotalpicola protaetiae]|uniref:Uncharacterized protein n=1 Tax=Gryllotalpicola protaetiae TaxID=2419771 RepID=A0A387BJX7_9MICO|nr:hypothetical protein [Gryllotalpicola protaetiae]AYG04153.1 hypothetical protein D7I44_11855 [Gryllotalpicola protaetiae]
MIPIVVVFAAVFIAASVTHSIKTGGGNDPAEKWGCGLAHPVVSPTPAAVGQTITITSGSAHCARDLPDGTGFEVTVVPGDGSAARVSGTASVHRDGSFAISLTIPNDFPAGEASVLVGDGEYVPCHDAGAGGSGDMRLVSCAAAETRFVVG